MKGHILHSQGLEFRGSARTLARARDCRHRLASTPGHREAGRQPGRCSAGAAGPAGGVGLPGPGDAHVLQRSRSQPDRCPVHSLPSPPAPPADHQFLLGDAPSLRMA